MARIKCNINEDSVLVQFGSLRKAEIFIHNATPFCKMDNIKGVNLVDGKEWDFSGDTLVTYVKTAELKLTI